MYVACNVKECRREALLLARVLPLGCTHHAICTYSRTDVMLHARCSEGAGWEKIFLISINANADRNGDQTVEYVARLAVRARRGIAQRKNK